MKLIILLTVIACFHASAGGFAQTVTISKKDASLETIFKEIKKQTGYNFIYNYDWLQSASKVSVEVTNAPLNQVLDLCFEGQPLTYEIVDKTISVKQRSVSSQSNDAVPSPLPPIDIHGKVVDESGKPVPGVTVSVKGSTRKAATDENGEFSIKTTEPNSVLIFTSANMETFQLKVKGESDLSVSLKPKMAQLGEVSVEVNTGYQKIPKERATGSFDFIDNTLLNRSVSTDILSRIDGVASGVIFNKNTAAFGNQSAITIRGRSTIFANPSPLIVVDNFPYDGDINNINPNDVESITILKDAAAASIWGVRAGNGVIIITSKKGKLNHQVKLTMNSFVTVGGKPNLFYGKQQIGTSDLIDVESFLFGKGYYNGILSSSSHSIIPTIVEILNRAQTGQISQTEASRQVSSLRNIDNRNDLNKYFYRKGVAQEYNFNLTGGGQNNLFFLSAGLDHNLNSLKNNDYNRVTVTGNDSYFLLNRSLEFTTGLTFTKNKSDVNSIGGFGYPYSSLVDNNGVALEIPYQYRQSYIDTLGGGRYLDWAYKPYDELKLSNNPTYITDFQARTSLKYKIISGLDATLLYQYSFGLTNNENFKSLQSYYTRNIINTLTNLSGTINNPIPIGGILDVANNKYETNNLRGVLSYVKKIGSKHEISVLVGGEYKNYSTKNRTYRLYGYDPLLQTSVPVDEVNFYPASINTFGSQQRIPTNYINATSADHYISYFGNGAYTYNGKYTLSASARVDQSNLFGVSTNLKTVPLWSSGASWDISKEPFYNFKSIPFLRLRITDGYNGNINKSLSAFTTAQASGTNDYNLPTERIINPPSPHLRWEKVHIVNAGVDFGSKDNRISGTLEAYVKHGQDLIGNSVINPSSGITTYTGNTASNRTQGIDITINTINIRTGHFIWSTNILYSYAKDQVTKYNFNASTISQYMTTININPVVGRPVYSVYAYKWAGLDSAGNPQGVMNGKATTNYSAIANSPDLSDLKYMGSAIPTSFGSLRNTLSYNQFSLSFNITFRMGYYFKRASLSYSTLYTDNFIQPDYSKRWMKPGDELKTSVPSMIYPGNIVRDNFYTNAEILVERADNIRWQDIQLSYDLNIKSAGNRIIHIKWFGYINNLGVIWRANNKHLDPDYYSSTNYIFPTPRSYSFGAKLDF